MLIADQSLSRGVDQHSAADLCQPLQLSPRPRLLLDPMCVMLDDLSLPSARSVIHQNFEDLIDHPLTRSAQADCLCTHSRQAGCTRLRHEARHSSWPWVRFVWSRLRYNDSSIHMKPSNR